MRKITVYLLFALLSAHIFSSCNDTLDLDEDTIVRLEKKDKLQKLDELFALSFEDPIQGKEEYDRFVAEELFTAERNYLVDNDIRISNNYTAGVVQLNFGFFSIQQELQHKSLFELYDTKFTSYINSRDFFGDIPLQLKTGDKYQRVKAKVDQINSFFDKKIDEKIANSVTDGVLTGKNWILNKSFYDWGFGVLHNIHFDFTLNEDKSSVINSFYFTPFARYSNTGEGGITDFPSNFLSAPRYATYDNKICFYFELKDNVDYVQNTGNIERSWVFEFSYQVEGNTLVLSEPRKRKYLAPSYLKDNFDDESFASFYPEELQSFTLTTTP